MHFIEHLPPATCDVAGVFLCPQCDPPSLLLMTTLVSPMTERHVYLETFGCQMNELDSELVAQQLADLGYRFTETAEHADVILYNTCSVRDQAEQKVRSRLGEMKLRKQDEPSLVVGVLGCMAERDGIDLITRMPVVDVLCGPGELDKLPTLIDNAVRTNLRRAADVPQPGRQVQIKSAKQVSLQGDASRRSATLAAAQDSLELLDLSRAVSPEVHGGSAYVRITRGCNKYCTYCVVPRTRGAEIHRPPDHIVDECKRLAQAGVIEITLLGQTVNHYLFEHGSAVIRSGVVQPQKGRSFRGGHRRDALSDSRTTTFTDLLRRIHEEVPELQRLRFVTSYPRDFGDDVLEVMRDSPRICRYLHVPAQSGSNAMLRRMNRGYCIEEYLEFIDRARAYLDQPEIGRELMIAGDMISGFCGETEDDHQASIELLERVQYKNCFIFRYSPRPGTTAFEQFADDVPEDVKRRRVNELLSIQHRISDEIAQRQVGRLINVFVQGVSAKEQKSRGMRVSGSRSAGNGHAVQLTVDGVTDTPSQNLSNMAVAERDLPVTPKDPPKSIQMTGRTDGDLVVVFDAPLGMSPDALIGRIFPIRILRANTLTLFGRAQIA